MTVYLVLQLNFMMGNEQTGQTLSLDKMRLVIYIEAYGIS